ncbi:MAG: twin-arginine translocase subunit TatB, partial [Alphaproteobacteria bacterium]|nr:twin-arginine translocase subunit TatB [Alphaproteobacteria bacterium]
MLVLLVLAIVVVGPKDLPRMLRALGQFVARARSMANEFRSSLDQIAREQELEELRRQVNELKRVEPLREAAREIEAAGRIDLDRQGPGAPSIGSPEGGEAPAPLA